MYYINTSPNIIHIKYQGKTHQIRRKETIDLPNEMHEFLLKNQITLTINYDQYRRELDIGAISVDRFIEICWMDQ